jgi:AcrR family transcriptional regulator
MAAAATIAHASRPDPTRPLRRDAELNLERIVQAAEDVIAESGMQASMEQIAARAGVGVGTLYRRFPGKESLVLAVLEMAGQRSLQLAETVLAECPPGEGIFEFMRRCLSGPPSLGAVVSSSPVLADAHRAKVASVAPTVDRLLAQARAAGTVRSDVTFSDIVVALMSVRSVSERAGAVGTRQGERHLQLLCDGLRTHGSTLPHRPLTRPQLDSFLVRD